MIAVARNHATYGGARAANAGACRPVWSIVEEDFVSDFDTIDYFTDPSLVPNPYPYFDHLRSQCPVQTATPYGVLAVTGYQEALAAYKDAALSSCNAVVGPFAPLPFEA